MDDQARVDDFLLGALFEALHDNASAQVVQGILDWAPEAVPLLGLQECIVSAFIRSRGAIDVEVVHLLLEYEPQIARSAMDRRNGQFLLHVACQTCVPLDILKLVIDSHPDAINEKDEDGRLPLHAACQEQASLDAIELLLARNPDAIRVNMANTGLLPLHLALVAKHPSDVILALLDAYPGVAMVAFDGASLFDLLNYDLFDGEILPLHLAVGLDCPSDVILLVLNAYPEAATVALENGELALHLLNKQCSRLSLEVLRRFIEANPTALRARDNDGSLPMHKACLNPKMTLEIVKCLVEQHPESIHAEGGSGQLPLHCAALKNPHLIHFLVHTYPNAVSAVSEDGTLPLHHALLRGSREVIDLLLDRYQGPESHHHGLSVRDRTGQVPLHKFPYHLDDASLRLLHRLIYLYPEATRVADRNGRLPLHLACNSHPPNLGTISRLVEADRLTVVEKTLDGMTPLQLRSRWQPLPHDIAAYLFEQQNEVVRALKEAVEDVGDAQLGLPDLVVANIWSLVKPNLWQPGDPNRI